MKASWNNIFSFLKTILMVFGVVCMLCSCQTEKGDVAAMEGELSGEESDLDEQQRACWQGELLAIFYDAMAASSLNAYPKVTKSAMPFMMVAFALWLSLRILKHISSVVEEGPAEVWTEVLKMAFVCLTCGLLASSTSFLLFVLNKLIFPIYYAFLEYGSEILNSLTQDGSMGSEGVYLGKPGDGFCIVYTNSLTCQAPTPSEIAEGQFPSGPSEMMQCLTCATSDRLQLGFALSRFLMTTNTLTAGICGFILYMIFTLVKIAFVFYMVDSIFRMNIMIILLPCFVLAYPFKYTRKWTKIGFLSVLNSSAILAFIAVLIAMSLLAIQYVLVDNADAFGRKDNYMEFGIIPLSLILIGFLVLKSVGIAVSLADSFVGGGAGTDFQKKIASLAAQAGKALFTWVTGGVGKLFMKNPAIQKMKEARDKVKQQMDKLAGRN